ncbi:hypothetical protein OS493_027021 [Desmophyllum pertusum]|uniref:Uncharacterized protein n=1 Tax=Desmophyllum pertusum TaxID=174260 RepID=A0A9W9YKT3_9CNID|nr:hypothetical protein OS493_027021 [Desmophyllum pertusum]
MSPSSKYRVVVYGVDGIGQPYKSLESAVATKKACNSAANQSAGLIDVTHTDYNHHDLLCYWTIGNTGVTHAVALFLFQKLDFDYCGEFVKISNGSGTVQFYQTGCWPSGSKKYIVEVPFGKSSNITVNILLSKLKSRVRVQFLVLQTGLNSATVLPGWTVSADNITSTSILIQWTNLTSLLNHRVLYYVIRLNRTNGNALIQRIAQENTLNTEVGGLGRSTNYRVDVFGVDELGRPYRTLTVNATTKNIPATSGPVVTSCNFDYGLCSGWQQSYSDVFDWTRRAGSTSSSNTGPSSDHTSGSGYYMYIETSVPRVAGDNAKLKLSVSGNRELSCLTFYYHMYGNSMGTLTVVSGNARVFRTSGNRGNYWLKAERTIYLANSVTFEGIVGSSYTGDLAIDDVSISSGSCHGPTTYPTLPPSTSPGKYMYIETSRPRVFRDNAKLEYSVSSSDVGKLSCLTFYYHMRGDDINTLNVFNGNTRVFTKSGNQGKEWFKAKITMNLQSKVTFEGIRGTEFRGDIAIDDVSITTGICQGCTENVNQSFGTLDVRYTSKFDSHCNWVIGHSGIDQAVAIVSIHQIFFTDISEYIKIFDGNGTEVFALHGRVSSFHKRFTNISFGEYKNITIQVSLSHIWSNVKIDFGTLNQGLDSVGDSFNGRTLRVSLLN